MGRDPVELAKRAKYQPPAMRVRSVCYTKKSPFRYNQYIESIRDIGGTFGARPCSYASKHST